MAILHRKLVPQRTQSTNIIKVVCKQPCDSNCFQDCKDSTPIDRYLITPPLPSGDVAKPESHHISTVLIIVFSILGASFLLGVCFLALVRYFSITSRRRNRNRNQNQNPEFDELAEAADFIDENQGPVVDHHIWLINTVGLPQSAIDSITEFRYKKGDGLIEEINCTVCLNEFQEDETLRLLPKCSHAFHVSCIDTWLRSHKNCPLCRALVASDSQTSSARSLAEPNWVSGSRQESDSPEQNLEIENRGESSGGSGQTSTSVEDNDEAIAKTLDRNNARFLGARNVQQHRVLSADHLTMTVDGATQPVRRSVSADSSTASLIYFAVANIRPGESEASEKKLLHSEIFMKRAISRRNQRIHRLVKSYSCGRSLQKVPVEMKRSFSSSRKLSVPRLSTS